MNQQKEYQIMYINLVFLILDKRVFNYFQLKD